MNFLADENIERQLVERLREAGHNVLYSADFEQGANDSYVLSTANTHSAILITDDKDFEELVYRRQLTHNGVTLLRLYGLSLDSKISILIQAVDDHAAELHGKFTVISPGYLRIRSA